MSTIQNITKTESKNTAVPKSTLGNILFCNFFGRFLFEHRHRADRSRGVWNNVSVFFAWIGRFNTHQNQVGIAGSNLGTEVF